MVTNWYPTRLIGLDEDVSFLYLAFGLALLGLGVGLGFGSATTAAIESAPRSLAGSAAGTNSMMRYVGSIVGAGLLAGVLNTSGASVPGLDTFRLIMGERIALASNPCEPNVSAYHARLLFTLPGRKPVV